MLDSIIETTSYLNVETSYFNVETTSYFNVEVDFLSTLFQLVFACWAIGCLIIDREQR